MKKILYIIAILVFSFAFYSCEKGFEDANENTFEPKDANTAGLLGRAQYEFSYYTQDAWLNGRMGMLYSQYWSQISYTNESRYRPRNSVTDSRWANLYKAAGTFNEIIVLNTLAKENENEKIRLENFGNLNNQIAVSKIIKAYIFHIITDIWGDVPYYEAFNIDKTKTPIFDTQESIYTDLLNELSEAQKIIDINKKGVVGDAIYYGDMTKWKKFANSLRMRIALRTSKVDTDYKSKVLAAFNDGAFMSNEDNALYHYSALNPYNNPLNENAKTRKDFAISESFLETLKKTNDPRLEYYANPTVNSVDADNPTYVGAVYGAESSSINPLTVSVPAVVGEGIYKATFEYPLMNYDEVCFIMAEINENESDMRSGIMASCEFWGVKKDLAETYANRIPYTLANNLEQKYTALYVQGLQAWAEWRRTGHPTNFKQPENGILDNAVPVNTYPRRRFYPTTAQSLNNANYKAVIKRQGEDKLSTRVWWDK